MAVHFLALFVTLIVYPAGLEQLPARDLEVEKWFSQNYEAIIEEVLPVGPVAPVHHYVDLVEWDVVCRRLPPFWPDRRATSTLFYLSLPWMPGAI